MSNLQISHVRSDGHASCEGRDLPADTTRERVLAHVAKTDHTARFVIEHITVYRAGRPAGEG